MSKIIYVYKSDKPNCGIIPDDKGLIFQFGEIEEKYPVKHLKISYNENLSKEELISNLQDIISLLKGDKKVNLTEFVTNKINDHE